MQKLKTNEVINSTLPKIGPLEGEPDVPRAEAAGVEPGVEADLGSKSNGMQPLWKYEVLPK